MKYVTIFGKVRCNNCMSIFDEEDMPIIEVNGEHFRACRQCKTDANLMAPFMEASK